jgi:hypothetical protein
MLRFPQSTVSFMLSFGPLLNCFFLDKELVKEAGVTNATLPPPDVREGSGSLPLTAITVIFTSLAYAFQAVMEVLVGYAIVILGVMMSAGSFIPIRSTEQIASRCVLCFLHYGVPEFGQRALSLFLAL